MIILFLVVEIYIYAGFYLNCLTSLVHYKKYEHKTPNDNKYAGVSPQHQKS